jgi:Spy/CpxP family protein refolding chaperone
MKRKLITLALVLLIGSALIAQPGNGDGNHGYNREGDRTTHRQEMLDKLQLTEEQKEKMDVSMISFHKTAQPIRNQLDEKRAALKSLTTVDSPDRKKIETVITEIGKLETSLLQAQVNHRLEVRSMLDDKQKILFDQHEGHRMMGRFDGKNSHGGPHR